MFRLPELIDEQARPDEVVEALHDWAGQEQHLLPLSNVDHLALTISVGSLNIKDILCHFAIHYAPNNLSYIFQISFISSI